MGEHLRGADPRTQHDVSAVRFDIAANTCMSSWTSTVPVEGECREPRNAPLARAAPPPLTARARTSHPRRWPVRAPRILEKRDLGLLGRHDQLSAARVGYAAPGRSS